MHAAKQVYIVIEGLEKYLGFDPNDPIVPFILFLGSSATLGYEQCRVACLEGHVCLHVIRFLGIHGKMGSNKGLLKR